MPVYKLSLPLTLNISQVTPFLGLKGETLKPELEDLLEQSILTLRSQASPRGVYAHFDVNTPCEDRLDLIGANLSITGSQTLRHFAACTKVTLLAVTLGNRVAAALAEISQKKNTEALIYDAVASAAAENLAEQLDSLIISGIIRKGFFPTARFSPGYGDWDLTWQKALVESVQGADIGLEVTPYFMLEPVKSITAAIGWSRTPIARNYENPGRLKPCQGSLSCPECLLKDYCTNK